MPTCDIYIVCQVFPQLKLFKENVKENTELGLWLEIVEPLTTACNMPYRSEKGLRWDWHIIPGFLMGYKPEEREKLAEKNFGVSVVSHRPEKRNLLLFAITSGKARITVMQV